MNRSPRRLVSVLAVLLLLSGLAANGADAAPAETQPADDPLDAYTAVVQPDEMSAIAQEGIDVSGQRRVANGVELDMVLDRVQADRLRGRGVDLRLTRVRGGQTVREFAAEQAADGFNVWRSYDEAGGIRDQLYAAARNNPQLVKLEVLVHTAQ